MHHLLLRYGVTQACKGSLLEFCNKLQCRQGHARTCSIKDQAVARSGLSKGTGLWSTGRCVPCYCLGSCQLLRRGQGLHARVAGDGHGWLEDVAGGAVAVLVQVVEDQQAGAGGNPDLLQRPAGARVMAGVSGLC
jgi:hypothetical protein